MTNGPQSGLKTTGNIIAVIGFIVVIAIGIWGTIAAVRLAPRMFETISGTFKNSDPAIELSLPSSNLHSGEPFVLSWKDAKRDSGFYTIRYGCIANISMEAPASDTDWEPMPCGTSYTIPASMSSIRLMPKITDTERVEFPLTITYITPAGEKESEGLVILTVSKPPAPVVEDSTPAPETTKVPILEESALATKPPVGKPDLAVRLISLGVIDQHTGQFIQKNVFGSYEMVVFKFAVTNIGQSRSGAWTFSTYFPTRMPTNYQPPIQQPLGLGERIEFTLNFTMPISGDIQINIDPSNATAETNEYNNALTQYISVSY